MNRSQGFTILELIIALAIASILVSLAVPAFNNAIGNSRLASNVNAMVGALNYARSEAVDRNERVRVQQAGDDWEIILVSDSSQIRQFSPPVENITITTGLANVTYEASGFRSAGSAAGTIDVCDTSRSIGRRISIAVSGSINLSDISC